MTPFNLLIHKALILVIKLWKTIQWKILFVILLWILFNYSRNQSRLRTNIMSSRENRTYNGQYISTEFEHFYKNVSTDKLMDPLIHKHQYSLLLDPGSKCKENHIFLLVLVYSAIYKFDERQVIRNTFGSIEEFDNTHIEYVFVLGETVNDTQQMDIEQESVKYRDLIQGNFIDSYRNLTYKRVFSLFWVNRFCNNVTYVIKIDDDITINIPFLIPYLSNKLNKTKVLECFLLIGALPYRNPRDKWYMSSLDYPFATFPPYCAGPSSIMSTDVISEMYKATKNVPFCWLEDVYGGGFLPWISRIEIVHPKCYIEDLRASLNDKPCHLFYINNSKNTSNSYSMWKTIENYTQQHLCKC